MPVHGRVESFDPATDDWSTYVERLEHYFIANDITMEAKHHSTLLTVAGPEVYSLACNLVAPDKPGDKSYDDLVALIKKHYSPTPSIIIQRYKFHTRVRNQGESIANFVVDLHNTAKHCEFNDALDDMLHDRLVCGVKQPKIQKRLLAEPEMFPFTRCKIKSKELPVIVVEVNILLQFVDLRTTNAIIVVEQGTYRRCVIRRMVIGRHNNSVHKKDSNVI